MGTVMSFEENPFCRGRPEFHTLTLLYTIRSPVVRGNLRLVRVPPPTVLRHHHLQFSPPANDKMSCLGCVHHVASEASEKALLL